MRLNNDKVDYRDSTAVNMTKGDIEMSANQLEDKLANFNHRKRVADYLIGKGLGEGSFAKVHYGLHTLTGEEVAIKVMNKAKARKDAYVHRNLRREGRILQLTRHRNIVQVYDVLETDNNYYVVTELCSGGDLIDIVTEKGCLLEKEVQSYVTQLVSAVVHLHSKGIVHRDLKVENMLLGTSGQMKLIDFGLSNTIPHSCTDKTSALATQCGSPAYAAPELLAKKKYGPKADVWSIGIITFALLVGKLPFTVEPFRIPKLCRKMMRGEMNPLPAHISSDCRFFIAQLLNPDPNTRPTAEHVSKLKWISRSYLKLGIHSPHKVDTDVVTLMSHKFGSGIADIINCVTKNRPGEALASYYLLCQRKNRLKNNPRGSATSEKRRTSVSRSTIGSDGNMYHSKTDSEKSANPIEDNSSVEDKNNNTVVYPDSREEKLQVRNTPQAQPPAANNVGNRETYLENKVRELKKKFNLSSKQTQPIDHKPLTPNKTQPNPVPIPRRLDYTTPTSYSDRDKDTNAMTVPQKTTWNNPAHYRNKLTLPEFTAALDKYDKSPTKHIAYRNNTTSSKTITRALEALQRAKSEARNKNSGQEKGLVVNSNTQRNKQNCDANEPTRPFSTPETRLTKPAGNNTLPVSRRSIDLTLSPQAQRKSDASPKQAQTIQKHSLLSQKYLVNTGSPNNQRTHSPVYVYNKQVQERTTSTKFPLLNSPTPPSTGDKISYANGGRFTLSHGSPTRSSFKQNKNSSSPYKYDVGSVTNKFQNLLNGRDMFKANNTSFKTDNLISEHIENTSRFPIKR